MTGTRRRFIRYGLGTLCAPTLCCSLIGLARAAEDDPALYHAYAIVTGTDMRQRPWGFAQCLREVLVKVSGDPGLKHDPRVTELADRADQFVASFYYVDMMAGIPRKDDQGSYDRPHKLIVYFDPLRIDRALARLGERPWRGRRPVVVPVLLVRGRRPPTYILTADIAAGRDQRDALATAAEEFGMRVRLPSDAELDVWGIAADHFLPAAAPLPGTSPGEAVVVGSIAWRETLPGWIGAWRTRWHGVDYSWGIRGVNYDAAFRNIIAGVVMLAAGRGSPR